MLIIKQKMIFREDIKANPHLLYIFGDNLKRYGFGGQAKEMRGEPNSFGIATKRLASHNYPEDYFHDEDPDVIGIIDEEFKELKKFVHEKISLYEHYFQAIVIPLDGIGTGLSKLPEKAPKLLEYINKKLEGLKEL